MNGSIVFLRDDDPEEEAIAVDTDDGGSLVIPYGETATLRLAYAISVHKAQGCEVPVVVGVCHRSHTRMLTRPLLYTAITRARSTCVLVGDRAALQLGGGARRRRRPPLGPGRAPARLSARAPDEQSGWQAAAGRDRGHAGGDRRCSPPWCWRSPSCATPSTPRSTATRPRSAKSSKASASAGPLLILGLALIHAVVFYPAEIVDAAAGFVYGFWPALALMMVGWLLSGLPLLRDRALGRPAAARPLARRRALRADRGGDRARRRHPADRGPPDPDPPLQPRLLRGGRRPRAALALRLDHGGRLPADHRARRLLRHPARGPQPHRPAGPRQRRGAAGPAARRAPDRAPRRRPAPGQPPPTRRTRKR